MIDELLESILETINDELVMNKERNNHFLVKPLFSLGELRALKTFIENANKKEDINV